MLSATDRAALSVLIRELGLVRALSVGLAVQWRTARGEPFQALAPAADAREAGSRAQAGPAVVLYRVLRERRGEADALRITGEVVEASAMVFLAETLGPLRRTALDALDEEGRAAFARDRADRFPNATLTWDEISRERVRFTVHACRLVELVAGCGHPELGPVFCRGDGRYFAEIEPGVRLERPSTIAGGQSSCAFTLSWAEREPPARG